MCEAQQNVECEKVEMPASQTRPAVARNVEYIRPMTPEELLTKVKQAKVGMKVHATWRANGDEEWTAWHGVVSAKAVFGMPSGQDLEDLKAEIERKAAEEQEKDEAAAREAAFMTNYGADSENDEPLNQLGSKSHLSTPSAASRTPIARRVHFAEPEATATLDCNGSFDELELELVRSP